MAQEAITNVARHAGVFDAQMELEFAEHQLILQVTDQGSGFDAGPLPKAGLGWGVAGMHERAESIGGHLDVTSVLGSGTNVKIIVPTGKKNNQKNENLHPVTEPERCYGNHPIDAG